tara:strand:- start:979 stop:1173 length:195 start_codon:yes stop_codon:yes gene_type:complete
MSTLYSILGIIGAVMVVFILYRVIKNQPEQFSAKNLNKSFATMGILALILIAFIALLVLMLRQG